MTDSGTIERRKEDRIPTEIDLLVWGLDTCGERFAQTVQAREISRSGALLSGLEGELRSGDVVGILYAGRKARYRVVWTRHSGTERKLQVAVHRFDGDACPWEDRLATTLPSEMEIATHDR